MKRTVWFPDERSGLQFDVEFIVDREIYANGIAIESITFGGSADFTQHFNDEAISQFEAAVLQQLSGSTINHHGVLITFAA